MSKDNRLEGTLGATQESFSTLWEELGLEDHPIAGSCKMSFRPPRTFSSEDELDEVALAATTDRELPRQTLGLGKESTVVRVDSPVPSDKRAEEATTAGQDVSDNASKDEPKKDIELQEVLGQGGMGIIWLARQHSLRRSVAAKVLREDKRSAKSREALLREAWLTGMLEHPSIIPIYRLHQGDDGEIQVVMKRIDGIEWETFLMRPVDLDDSSGGQGSLEWHLRILLKLCDAVRYAHSQGIIHRDLKPENVMIGEFGEVYALDWGLAVSMRKEHDGVLPLARDIKHLSGTPSYMAPEMVSVSSKAISERTDVYLLGAILHQIVIGKPPHLGNSLHEIIMHAYESEPYDYPDVVPRELVSICLKAMARVPKKRYKDVEAFGQAIRQFLHHRASFTLVRESQEGLDKMKVLLQKTPEEQETRGIYELFAECKFGFTQALKIWPENEDAKTGLQEALVEMIQYELEQDNVKVAELHLHDLPIERPDLEKRILKLLNKEKMVVEDDGESRSIRGQVSFAIGLLWCLLPILYIYAEHTDLYKMTHLQYILLTIPTALSMGALVYLARDTLFHTKLNRHVLRILVVCNLALFFNRVGGTMMELPLLKIVSFDLLVGTLVVASIAVAFELRLVFSSLAYCCGFLVASYQPDWAFWCLAFSNLIGLSYMAYIWRGEPPPKKVRA